MAAEQTFVLVKPDGLKKSLTGNILTTLSETKLKIIGTKMVRVSKKLAEEHYKALKKKPFYDELIRYITGKLHGDNRILALVYHGPDAIGKVRKLCGETNPEKADPTTIRGKYGRILSSGVFENAIHSSGSKEEAEREIKLWFKPEELTIRIYPSEKKKANTYELVWK